MQNSLIHYHHHHLNPPSLKSGICRVRAAFEFWRLLVTRRGGRARVCARRKCPTSSWRLRHRCSGGGGGRGRRTPPARPPSPRERRPLTPPCACARAAAAGLKTAKAASGSTAASGAVILAGSQTLGKMKKGGKGVQRHSAGNIDLDSVDSDCTPQAAAPAQPGPGQFRGRSKTVSDAHGRYSTYASAQSPSLVCSLFFVFNYYV